VYLIIRIQFPYPTDWIANCLRGLLLRHSWRNELNQLLMKWMIGAAPPAITSLLHDAQIQIVGTTNAGRYGNYYLKGCK